MRPRIQGWTSGLLIFGAGCFALAARAASEPPAHGSRGSYYDPPSEARHHSPRPYNPPSYLNRPGSSGTRRPSMPAPPERTWASQPPVRDAVRLESPVPNESNSRFPSRSTRNATQVIETSFESVPAPTQASAAPPKPVAQFARQFPSDMQQRGDDPVMQRPPTQPPDSAEVPANVGQVDVQGLDQLGVIILRGNPQDVENMKRIIEEIQRISEAVEPYVRVFQLHRASATQIRDTILELYSGSSGTTGGGTQRATTGQGQTTTQGGSAGSSSTSIQLPSLKRFQIAADDRSNTLVVSASPQMMEEISRLIDRLDADGAPTVNEVRVFQLKNAEATEVANILTQAISGQAAGTAGETIGGTAATVAGGGEARIANRAAVLRFVPLEGDRRAIESGILDEVRITAQIRTNSVIVSAPASSMPLLASIVAELDKPPSIVASMKVFQLKYSDATNMRLTLAELFDLEPSTATGTLGGGGAGATGTTSQFQRPIAVASGDAPPVSVRVAVDERTNSLIVSGPENALLTIEAVIRKLDLSDIHNRKSTVYRLKNSQASDVALALTQFFTNKRTIEAQQTGVTGQQGAIVGAYQRLEQDVIVVALDNTLAAVLSSSNSAINPLPANVNTQGVSNLLLVSAAPRYYDEVIKMLEELDAPQPQVMIQVVIAQLVLNDDFEFGIELGLQDDVFFNRSGVSTDDTTGLETLVPGFNFGSDTRLPNSTVASPSTVGGQGVSGFNLGRLGNLDSFGPGLLLSASSESVSALLRALQVDRKLEIISRPQIMTLDGRTARVTVGQSFPYVGEITQSENFVTPQVSFLQIGVILTVKPSITPDERIYLEVAPEVTELLALIPVNASGTLTQVAPQTSITAANTVVSVADGQTIVLGGLIQKRNNNFVRKIPWLGDLPHLGFLFRYTQEREEKRELLIFMTPHIVRSDADAQRIKEIEMARVNWIMENAPAIHGDLGLPNMLPETAAPCNTHLTPSPLHSSHIQPMAGEEPPKDSELTAPTLHAPPVTVHVRKTEQRPTEPAPESNQRIWKSRLRRMFEKRNDSQ